MSKLITDIANDPTSRIAFKEAWRDNAGGGEDNIRITALALLEADCLLAVTDDDNGWLYLQFTDLNDPGARMVEALMRETAVRPS